MNSFETCISAARNALFPDRGRALDAAASLQIRDHMKDHTDLNPIIDEILGGTHTLPIADDVLLKHVREPNNIRAYNFWKELKPSLNALSSIFISDIWESFAQERADLLLRNPSEMPSSLLLLQRLTKDIFDHALKTWDTTQQSMMLTPQAQETPKTVAYRQFKKIFDFGYRNSFIPIHDELPDFIGHGIFTATRTTWGVVDLVPTLAHRQHIRMTRPHALQTVNRAYGPIISMFSSMNKSLAIPILMHIQPRPELRFIPSFFYLSKGSDGYTLHVHHDKLLDMKDTYGNPIIQNEHQSGATTWCPAKYTIPGKENVIHGFANWTIAVGERFFEGMTSLPIR